MKSTARIFLGLQFLFLLASASFADSDGLVKWWKFDDANGLEDVAKINIEFAEGASGTCIKTDGYTSSIIIGASELPAINNSFSISAWIALQTYPWNWSAIIDQSSEKNAGYFLV